MSEVDCGGSMGMVDTRLRSIMSSAYATADSIAQGMHHCSLCNKKLTLLQRVTSGLCHKHSAHRLSWEKHYQKLFASAGIPQPSCADDQVIHGKRPDFGWELADRIVILEIDEHSHNHRTSESELEKLYATTPTVEAGKPLLVMRYNPSHASYTRYTQCTATLIAVLRAALFDTEYLAAWALPPIINVIYLFYAGDQSLEHIRLAQQDKSRLNVMQVYE
jgi:hypothetical protein